MVRIRLFRTGATKRPSYRIVVMDGRRPRQGRFLENLGTYEPRRDGALTLDEPALDRWLERGAQMSDTVASLVRRHRRRGASDAAGNGEVPAPAAPADSASGDVPAAP